MSKFFPCFTVPPNTSEEDREFLTELKLLREKNNASFVNFSIYDYELSTPDVIHFVTYPMEWITRYIRRQYAEYRPGFDD